MMSDDKVLEVVVELGKVVNPPDYRGLSAEKVFAWLDHTGQPYRVTNILHHSDGTSGFYDIEGRRIGYYSKDYS